MKTLLYIRKASPTGPQGPRGAKTTPAKLPQVGAKPAQNPGGKAGSASGVEWEYYSGSGAPPPNGGWQQTPNGKGYRRPKGSGPGRTPAKQEESVDNKTVVEEQIKEVLRTHNPENESDPLKEDDGSTPGEESLTEEDGVVEDVKPGSDTFYAIEEVVEPGSKTDAAITEDPEATRINGIQDTILEKISEFDGPVNVKEVRSAVEAHSQGMEYSGKKVSKKKDSEGVPSAQKDADNFTKRGRENKPFKMKQKPKGKGDKNPPIGEKTAPTQPMGGEKTAPTQPMGGEKTGEDAVDPYAKTEYADGTKDAKDTKDNSDPKDTPEARTAERRRSSDAKRPRSSKEDIAEASKRAKDLETAKDEHKQAKSDASKKTKEIRDKSKKIRSDLSSAKKELAQAKKDFSNKVKAAKNYKDGTTLEQVQAARDKKDALEEKVKEHQKNLDENEAKHKEVASSVKDAEEKVSAAEKLYSDVSSHHGKSLPETPSEKIAHKEHTEKAKERLKNIEAHIDQDPDNEDLWQLREIYAEQAEIEHIPTAADKSALSGGDSFSKKKGVDKHPEQIKAEADAADAKQQAATFKEEEKQAKQQAKEEAQAAKQQEAQRKKDEAERQRQQRLDAQARGRENREREAAAKKRASSSMAAYNSGGSVGSSLGRFGTKGGITEGVDLAARVPKGVVSAGHHLLSKESENPDDEDDEKKDPTKKKDPEKEVEKSMRLYIKKATGPTPNVSVNSDKSKEEIQEDYEESFDKRTAGTMGGSASPDLPGKGRKMNRSSHGSSK